MLKEEHIDYDAATGRLRTTPRQVFLELTPRCNLACVHCPRDYGHVKEGPERDMPWSIIEELKPWLRDAISVHLNIVGEPLIATHFADTLELCGELGTPATFNTNGIGLHPEMVRRIVASGTETIAIVSFDGTTANLPIRGVPYETVRARLEGLANARDRAGAEHLRIGLAYTLMRRNLFELPLLLEDLLSRARIHYVHVQPMIAFYETTRGQNVYDVDGIEEVFARSREIAAAHGTELTLFRSTLAGDERDDPDKPSPQVGQYSERYGCIDVFYEIKIRATGQVQACSYGLEPPLRVGELPLDEIWNHDWYRGMRRQLHGKRFEDKCRSCPFVHGSAAAQEDPLRVGVHHSQARRFLTEAGHSA